MINKPFSNKILQPVIWLKMFLFASLLSPYYLNSAENSAGSAMNDALLTQNGFKLNRDYFKVSRSLEPQLMEKQQESVTSNLAIETNFNSDVVIPDLELFYWYGSEASQQVEALLSEYLIANPGLVIKRTPLVARVSWRAQAYIQAILEQVNASLDKSEESLDPMEIYQLCIQDCSVFASYEQIVTWLVKRMEFKQPPNLEEALIWQAEKNYRKRAEKFSINQVPTILIKHKYKIDANSAKSAERFIEIVDFLLNEKSG